MRIAAVSLLFATSPFVFAQSPAQSVDPVVVTANRIPQTLSSSLSDVQIIDADEIARSSGASLTDLLRARAGIEISSTGGPGQPSGLFMRGTNSNHVVILLDGVRIHSATSGTTALEQLPLNQIARIEILSGPASSLYGADAIGGVIHIMTQSYQAEDKLQLSALFGSEKNSNYSISYNKRVEATQFQFGAGYAQSDNRSATNERVAFGFNPDRDPYRNKNFRLGVSHEISREHSIGLTYLRSDGVTHFDGGPDTDDINRQTLATLKLESYNRFTPEWDALLRVARSRDKLDTTGAFSSRFATTQDQWQWENRIKSDIGTITAGADATRQQVESDTVFSQTRRDIAGVYAGLIQQWDAHQWQLNARYDRLSGYGGNTVGSTAYAYTLQPGLRALLNAGTAFKAPSFNDLYYPDAFGFKGNPNLKPERARNLEAALEYRAGNNSARLSHYRNRLDDLIVINADFSSVENLARARIVGTSLRVDHALNNMRLRADMTFQNASDDGSGNRLPRRARRFGGFGAHYNTDGWQIGGDVIASDDRYDSPVNTPANRMGGYALVNLFMRSKLSDSLRLQARIDNALDKNYELAQGYNTTGRRFFAGLDWQLK